MFLPFQGKKNPGQCSQSISYDKIIILTADTKITIHKKKGISECVDCNIEHGLVCLLVQEMAIFVIVQFEVEFLVQEMAIFVIVQFEVEKE